LRIHTLKTQLAQDGKASKADALFSGLAPRLRYAN